MPFLENPDSDDVDTGPIPEAWFQIQIKRTEYLEFMATVERITEALQMIGRWDGSIKPYIVDPKVDAVRLIRGGELMGERLEPIDAPPALPVMVEWELHRLLPGNSEIPFWEKLQAGSCEESKLPELSPIQIERGYTYRIALLDDEGELRLVYKEFTV